MIRYISHGVQANALKYLVYDQTEEKIYNLDVELLENGKIVRLLDNDGQEQGFFHMSTLEEGTSVWIGLHEHLVGSVCLKRNGEEFCITIPCWSVQGNPYSGEFSILKSGNRSVSVMVIERNGIPYEKLDIAEDQDEHLILLLVLAIEEAVIGRRKKNKKTREYA